MNTSADSKIYPLKISHSFVIVLALRFTQFTKGIRYIKNAISGVLRLLAEDKPRRPQAALGSLGAEKRRDRSPSVIKVKQKITFISVI